MRHGKKGNHLGRKKGHRIALMKNMSNALIKHKRIFTTLAKAKALRGHLEPLITKAKTDTTHSRRVVFSYLQDKESIKEMFGPIAAKVGDRPGGYLRVIRTGFRKSDAAEMGMIEFVDYNDVMKKSEPGKAATAGKTRRTRRGKKSSATSAATATAAAATASASEEE